MRYAPSEGEREAIAFMDEAELLEYFITRTAEAEEVWGLGGDAGWVMREHEARTSLPVWPYRVLAQACARGEWHAQKTHAVSLEHFISRVLHLLIDRDIAVEIMPTDSRPGLCVHPRRLFELFEGVLDTGEYTLEG